MMTCHVVLPVFVQVIPGESRARYRLSQNVVWLPGWPLWSCLELCITSFITKEDSKAGRLHGGDGITNLQQLLFRYLSVARVLHWIRCLRCEVASKCTPLMTFPCFRDHREQDTKLTEVNRM